PSKPQNIRLLASTATQLKVCASSSKGKSERAVLQATTLDLGPAWANCVNHLQDPHGIAITGEDLWLRFEQSRSLKPLAEKSDTSPPVAARATAISAAGAGTEDTPRDREPRQADQSGPNHPRCWTGSALRAAAPAPSLATREVRASAHLSERRATSAAQASVSAAADSTLLPDVEVGTFRRPSPTPGSSRQRLTLAISLTLRPSASAARRPVQLILIVDETRRNAKTELDAAGPSEIVRANRSASRAATEEAARVRPPNSFDEIAKSQCGLSNVDRLRRRVSNDKRRVGCFGGRQVDSATNLICLALMALNIVGGGGLLSLNSRSSTDRTGRPCWQIPTDLIQLWQRKDRLALLADPTRATKLKIPKDLPAPLGGSNGNARALSLKDRPNLADPTKLSGLGFERQTR
uniref:SRCR domain-containing protein n=1 Tax=Macrostomum lignano TaxID=282301 RepID=A0A1I8JNR9_9PLAT